MARAVTSVGERITALASAGTLYLLSNQNVILTAWAAVRSCRSCRPAHRRCARRRRRRCRCCCRSRRRRGCRSIRRRCAATTTTPPTSITASAHGQAGSERVRVSRPACRGCEAGHLAGSGHQAPASGVGSRGRLQTGGAVGGRPGGGPPGGGAGGGSGRGSSRWTGQRQARRTAALVTGVAGDGVGQGQPRFAALPGPRERHRQRRGARLTDLRVDELRRQHHVGVQAEVGERGVDERLHELAGQQVGEVGLEERADDTDSPSDIA